MLSPLSSPPLPIIVSYHVCSSSVIAFVYTYLHEQNGVLCCVFSVFINSIMVSTLLQLDVGIVICHNSRSKGSIHILIKDFSVCMTRHNTVNYGYPSILVGVYITVRILTFHTVCFRHSYLLPVYE